MPLIIPASQTLVAGEQIIAPSSNDWDYTFDGGGDWPTAGNTLGDHTIGGYIDNTSGDSALSSLITFDGDFEITWTAVASLAGVNFGVHEITEDESRAANQQNGMGGSVQSFRYQQSVDGGANDNHFWIGATQESGSSNVFAVDSVIKIERISGTIKVYDDDVEVHEFTSTTSNPVRFFIGSDGNTAHDFEDIFFTDSDKVQRDGFINEARTGDVQWGDGVTNAKNMGQAFVPTRTGTVSTVTIVSTAVYTSFTGHCEIWGHDGTNPTSQIGSDSDSIVLDAVQNWTFTFSSEPEVNKGSVYWVVFVDEGTSGDLAFDTTLVSAQDFVDGWGLGFNDTITSITDSETDELAIEIAINTTSEPTPDHDTLLLLQSDTTDGSTTFTDSSQVGRTVTVVGDTQHSTSIKKFGASSILFDGTGDYLTIADSTDWDFGTGDFTVDFWGYNLGGSDSNVVMFGDSSYNLTVGYIHTTTLVTYISSNGSSWDLANAVSMGTFPSTNWVHYALVRSGTSFKTYKAGTEISSFTSSATVATGSGITIGQRNTADLSGNIEELRISKVARWDADFTPPTSPYPTT